MSYCLGVGGGGGGHSGSDILIPQLGVVVGDGGCLWLVPVDEAVEFGVGVVLDKHELAVEADVVALVGGRGYWVAGGLLEGKAVLLIIVIIRRQSLIVRRHRRMEQPPHMKLIVTLSLQPSPRRCSCYLAPTPIHGNLIRVQPFIKVAACPVRHYLAHPVASMNFVWVMPVIALLNNLSHIGCEVLGITTDVERL